MEKIKQLKTLYKKYQEEILKDLINKSKIIIDFTLVSTERRHKLIPYKNIESNTIILNVDLKTGTIDSFFNGEEFNLKPFFEKDERTQLNAKEW